MAKKTNNNTEQVVDIDTLRQDTHNFNRGTDEGQQLMERSFKELGAGRSILLDREGNIIAGNKSQEAARKAGIKRVRIVETTGDELIAVKRTDIDIDSAEGRRMALLDNLTTQVNLAWDTSEIETVQAEMPEFDVADFGFNIEDMPYVVMPSEKSAGEDVNDKPAGGSERQRDPDSEIIVATVSLFGTTEDMMLTQILSKENADKLIALAKTEGADNLMKRIIAAL